MGGASVQKRGCTHGSKWNAGRRKALQTDMIDVCCAGYGMLGLESSLGAVWAVSQPNVGLGNLLLSFHPAQQKEPARLSETP
eukprot:2544793-Rhodomonas_salina.4